MELEIILSAWKHSYESATPTRSPKLWVGYWRDGYAGSLHMPTVDEQALFFLAAPFAVSDVLAEAVVIDRTTHVVVSAISSRRESGFMLTHWKVDRHVSDTGRLRFFNAHKTPGPPYVDSVLCHVGHARLTEGPSHSYEEAFQTAWLLAERS